jgi:hypothetical protein
MTNWKNAIVGIPFIFLSACDAQHVDDGAKSHQREAQRSHAYACGFVRGQADVMRRAKMNGISELGSSKGCVEEKELAEHYGFNEPYGETINDRPESVGNDLQGNAADRSSLHRYGNDHH